MLQAIHFSSPNLKIGDHTPKWAQKFWVKGMYTWNGIQNSTGVSLPLLEPSSSKGFWTSEILKTTTARWDKLSIHKHLSFPAASTHPLLWILFSARWNNFLGCNGFHLVPEENLYHFWGLCLAFVFPKTLPLSAYTVVSAKITSPFLCLSYPRQALWLLHRDSPTPTEASRARQQK